MKNSKFLKKIVINFQNFFCEFRDSDVVRETAVFPSYILLSLDTWLRAFSAKSETRVESHAKVVVRVALAFLQSSVFLFFASAQAFIGAAGTSVSTRVSEGLAPDLNLNPGIVRKSRAARCPDSKPFGDEDA